MHKRKLIASLFIGLVLVSFCILDAQEKEHVIIISERVGEEIDREERDKYNLFPGVPGFQSAIFYANSDSTYFLEINYLDEKSGELKTNRIQQSKASIQNRAYNIDNFGKIQAKMPVENEKITERSEIPNDESTQPERVDFAERKICITFYGVGLPIVENGPQKFDGSLYGTGMIYSPQFPLALLLSSGYGQSEEIYEKEGFTHEFSYIIIDLLYRKSITKSKKTNIFTGAGIGSIDVEEYRYGTDHSKTTSILYSMEIGCKTQTPFLGLFIKYKWFYAKDLKNCTQLILGIDFNIYF